MVGTLELVVVREPDRGPCRAAMLTCVDHRFLRPACDLLEREGLLGSTDLIAWPGGAMALLTEGAEELLSALELDPSPFGCGVEEMIDDLTSPFPRTWEDAR